MSETLAHKYSKEGSIDAFRNYIKESPNDVNIKDNVSV